MKQQQATFYSDPSISGNGSKTGSHSSSQAGQQEQRQNANLQAIKGHAQSNRVI